VAKQNHNWTPACSLTGRYRKSNYMPPWTTN